MDAGALAEDWLAAFRAVPRELFVPDRIWPGVADGSRQTALVDRAKDPVAWRAAVYSDVPLTTQWDDGRHRGDGLGTRPTSSSSMPRMVFSMLADLEVTAVRDGGRALEIGTGTGWNAGLLAHRLGGGNVVSVEYDATVARAAVANLRRAGLEAAVVVGDGRLGHGAGGPYSRTVATCSVGDVPYDWVRQTEDGGIIVAPWGTEYGGEAVVRLIVADGVASGSFTRSSAFMRLRQQRLPRPPFAAYLRGRAWPADGVRSTTSLSPAETGGWLAQFVIGLRVPGVFWRAERYGEKADGAGEADGTGGADGGGAYTLWLYSADTASWATADVVPGAVEFAVVQSGPRALWTEVEAAFRWWDRAGRPGFERFGLTVGADGQRAWLDRPGEGSWRV
ncbi:protein-L-isoaspartate(D-aspartate) O-methyltransferase [Streptomyces paludis]|uniref:Protein-L-isoaspartate O-methyltransferase n=1 Tax=Streptomyces paludis TaxID=2282738 RepID=A0A345I1Q7_9ACTN|nr:protein-L-isoaspartate(D-aspartate) O-methyltransferase [Streptomyces paludis]